MLKTLFFLILISINELLHYGRSTEVILRIVTQPATSKVGQLKDVEEDRNIGLCYFFNGYLYASINNSEKNNIYLAYTDKIGPRFAINLKKGVSKKIDKVENINFDDGGYYIWARKVVVNNFQPPGSISSCCI